MGKRRKTLKEKKISELRQSHVVSKQTTSGSLDETATQPIAPLPIYAFQTKKITQVTPIYSLSHDLRKTLFVSSAIVILELILYFLLKSNMLVLPLVSLRY